MTNYTLTNWDGSQNVVNGLAQVEDFSAIYSGREESRIGSTGSIPSVDGSTKTTAQPGANSDASFAGNNRDVDEGQFYSEEMTTDSVEMLVANVDNLSDAIVSTHWDEKGCSEQNTSLTDADADGDIDDDEESAVNEILNNFSPAKETIMIHEGSSILTQSPPQKNLDMFDDEIVQPGRGHSPEFPHSPLLGDSLFTPPPTSPSAPDLSVQTQTPVLRRKTRVLFSYVSIPPLPGGINASVYRSFHFWTKKRRKTDITGHADRHSLADILQAAIDHNHHESMSPSPHPGTSKAIPQPVSVKKDITKRKASRYDDLDYISRQPTKRARLIADTKNSVTLDKPHDRFIAQSYPSALYDSAKDYLRLYLGSEPIVSPFAVLYNTRFIRRQHQTSDDISDTNDWGTVKPATEAFSEFRKSSDSSKVRFVWPPMPRPLDEVAKSEISTGGNWGSWVTPEGRESDDEPLFQSEHRERRTRREPRITGRPRESPPRATESVESIQIHETSKSLPPKSLSTSDPRRPSAQDGHPSPSQRKVQLSAKAKGKQKANDLAACSPVEASFVHSIVENHSVLNNSYDIEPPSTPSRLVSFSAQESHYASISDTTSSRHPGLSSFLPQHPSPTDAFLPVTLDPPNPLKGTSDLFQSDSLSAGNELFELGQGSTFHNLHHPSEYDNFMMPSWLADGDAQNDFGNGTIDPSLLLGNERSEIMDQFALDHPKPPSHSPSPRSRSHSPAQSPSRRSSPTRPPSPLSSQSSRPPPLRPVSPSTGASPTSQFSVLRARRPKSQRHFADMVSIDEIGLDSGDEDTDQYVNEENTRRSKSNTGLPSKTRPTVGTGPHIKQAKIVMTRRFPKHSWHQDPVSSFCHQCRNTNTIAKMECGCSKKFCLRCLSLRYDGRVMSDPEKPFVCPVCANICTCDVCCRKRGDVYVPLKPRKALAEPGARRERPRLGGKTNLPPRASVASIGSVSHLDTTYGSKSKKPSAYFRDGENENMVHIDLTTPPATSAPLPIAAQRKRPRKRVFIGVVQPSWRLGEKPIIRDLRPTPAKEHGSEGRQYVGKKAVLFYALVRQTNDAGLHVGGNGFDGDLSSLTSLEDSCDEAGEGECRGQPPSPNLSDFATASQRGLEWFVAQGPSDSFTPDSLGDGDVARAISLGLLACGVTVQI